MKYSSPQRRVLREADIDIRQAERRGDETRAFILKIRAGEIPKDTAIILAWLGYPPARAYLGDEVDLVTKWSEFLEEVHGQNGWLEAADLAYKWLTNKLVPGDDDFLMAVSAGTDMDIRQRFYNDYRDWLTQQEPFISHADLLLLYILRNSRFLGVIPDQLERIDRHAGQALPDGFDQFKRELIQLILSGEISP